LHFAPDYSSIITEPPFTRCLGLYIINNNALEISHIQDITMIKTIFLTFSASITIFAVVCSLFLNPILGAFGLVTTSAATLHSLRTSDKIVHQMKQRHKHKKTRIAKKMAKQSGKRVASAALAAATLGTVAVAITVASLEIADYCENKKELQEDYNILYDTNTVFDLNQCLDAGKKDSKAILDEVKNSTTAMLSDAMNVPAEYSSAKWHALKEASMQALNFTNSTAEALWHSATSWLDK